MAAAAVIVDAAVIAAAAVIVDAVVMAAAAISASCLSAWTPAAIPVTTKPLQGES